MPNTCCIMLQDQFANCLLRCTAHWWHGCSTSRENCDVCGIVTANSGPKAVSSIKGGDCTPYTSCADKRKLIGDRKIQIQDCACAPHKQKKTQATCFSCLQAAAHTHSKLLDAAHKCMACCSNAARLRHLCNSHSDLCHNEAVKTLTNQPFIMRSALHKLGKVRKDQQFVLQLDTRESPLSCRTDSPRS